MFELGSAFSCDATSPLTSPVQFQLTPSATEESSEHEADDLAESFSESPSNDMFDPCMYLQEGKPQSECVSEDSFYVDLPSNQNPEQIPNNSSDVLFFPLDVFGFFANGAETEATGLDTFYQKDLALWNNTLHDFLIFDDDGQH